MSDDLRESPVRPDHPRAFGPSDHFSLLYRRQFILGPWYVEDLLSWTRVRISDTLKLSAHPDLLVSRIASGNTSITLLGYLLDPARPEADDHAIVTQLMAALSRGGFDAVLAATESLGGRWVLIVDDGANVRLFTDPMGLRQVCYTNELWHGETWCATQPGLIARVCGLTFDPTALTAYIHSDAYAVASERPWPGDTTPYAEVSHLLPNHFLRLTDRAAIRFWPEAPLEKCAIEDASESGSSMLSELVTAAGRRYKLGMAVTSGWDSRVLLAASRQVADRMFFYTFNHGRNAADTVVPQRLLPKLGLQHHLIKYPARMDPAFAKIYNQNFPTPHDSWGRMMQPLVHKLPAHTVVLTGNAAEITRVRFRLPEGERLTARKIARFTYCGIAPRELERNTFVVTATDRWLKSIGNTYNVHPLDLFYWELRAGRFAAMDQGEWDIAQESFTPYNCRRYLATMLAVDERYRSHDDPIHYRLMIRNLWPDVLSEPVNPRRRPPVWATRIRQLRFRTRRATQRLFGNVVAGRPLNVSAGVPTVRK